MFGWRKTLPTRSEKIELYDRRTIDTLEWPKHKDANFLKKLLIPLIKNGIDFYFDNISADIFALAIDHHVFPVIVTSANCKNSYVCSPYSHYISFGQEYIGLIGNKLLMTMVKSFLKVFERIARIGKFDSVVYVNNWLFSTDLYPDKITKEQISSIVNLLKDRFPNRAILFRSLNPITCESLEAILKINNFHLIASRYVYITNTQDDYIFQTRIFKSDLKLRKETNYEILNETHLTGSDSAQLLKLYNTLYIKQHSPLQPQLNLKYMQLLIDQKILKFKVIKQNGIIHGVAGYYETNGVMMCPFFGYDKTDPQHNIIYRLLNTELLLEARKRKLIFHQSAGASVYKTIRRAQGCLESMAVYTEHLPLKQSLYWNLLRGLVNQIAPKYMKKY